MIIPYVFRRAFSFAALLVLCFTASAQDKPDGARLYRTHCAGCHGPSLEGSVAPALKPDQINYGSDRKSLIKSIKYGVVNTEMISWEKVLQNGEAEALADFILAFWEKPAGAVEERPLEVSTRHYDLKIENIITEGIDGPWGFEFVDNRRALITGKKGDLYWMVDNKLDPKKITGLPFSYAWELVGGMMDLAIDPNYRKNGWVYLAFSSNKLNSKDRNAPGMTKLVRGKVKGYEWTDEQTLFEAPDSVLVEGGTRWGTRLFFDKQGYLYFTVGDMGKAVQEGDAPQSLTRAEGKIFRFHPDGRIPKTNPYAKRKGVLQGIYATGTRNVQGIAQHPVTGTIYFTDHGPQGGDELNILKNGGNYGWPLVSHGVNYNDSPVTPDTTRAGMEDPILYWTPSIAVCAAEFANSPLFPKWKDHLFVTALKFEELRRLVVQGNKVVEQEILLKNYGRVRDAKIGPDGALYVLTNAPDRLIRIIPK